MQAVLQQAEPSNTSRAAVVQSPWALRKRICATCHKTGASDIALMLTALSNNACHIAFHFLVISVLAPSICSSCRLLYAHEAVRAERTAFQSRTHKASHFIMITCTELSLHVQYIHYALGFREAHLASLLGSACCCTISVVCYAVAAAAAALINSSWLDAFALTV
jgi:hypothetical protein